MSLQMIIGGEGSHRSEYMYQNLIEEALKKPEQQFYLIVPEQYTMQTQMKMTEMHPGHGVMNIDIVSFPRLAYRVFEEIGGIKKTILEDTGKRMVIRKLLSNNREDFGVFAGSLYKNGFVEQAKSMLSELFQYSVGSAQIEESRLKVGETTILGKKLKDIQILYDAFKDYMADTYMTAEELLSVLADRISFSDQLKGSRVYVDNFTGFTPSQYRLLEELMKICDKVVIGLCIDIQDQPYELGQEYQLFYLTKETLWKLNQLCRHLKISQEPDILLSSSAPKNELDFLERHLFRFRRFQPWMDEPHQVELFALANPTDEVHFAATKIRQMVMEQDMSYKDFALVTGDVARYSDMVQDYFFKMDIPVFVDDKASLLENSFVEMLRSAMEVIVKDFTYESVFRYLRCGYSKIDAEKVDVLDNYVLATGLRGKKRWSDNFIKRYRDYQSEDFMLLNETRKQVMAELEPLFSMIKQGTVREYTRALRAFIRGISGEEQLNAYMDQMNTKGDFVRARIYGQVYEAVKDLLDKFEQILGEEIVSLKEYMEILESGVEEIKVGVIPPTLDQVVLGDLKRTRLGDIKVVFILGCNDGVLPTPVSSSGLLSDREKELLMDCPMELAPTGKQNSFREKFYIYSAMTKPSEMLILTYAQMDGSGKTLRPSTIINDMTYIFPKLKTKLPDIFEKGRILSGLEESKSYMLQGMRYKEHRDILWKNIFAWLMKSEKHKNEVETWMHAMFDVDVQHRLSKRIVEALYGMRPTASITTLEKYAACAYAHFLKAGLKLEERKAAKLLPPDMGNILHESMERFSKIVEESIYTWKDMPDEFRETTIERVVRETGMEYGSAIFLESARHGYYLERLVKMAKRTVWTIQKQICKGDFVPKGFETQFAVGDKVRLIGTVDRYDVYDEEDIHALRIVDYKSGMKDFDLTEVYYGLSIQLVVYLESMSRIEAQRYPDKRIIKAGMFYYHMHDPVLENAPDQPEELEKKLISQLKMEGLANEDLNVLYWMDRHPEEEPQILSVKLNKSGDFSASSLTASSEQMDQLGFFVNRRIEELVDGWMSGDISKNPYLYMKDSKRRTACDFCEYKGICRFDEKLESCKYHRLMELKADTIWERIYEEVKDAWENHGQKNKNKSLN